MNVTMQGDVALLWRYIITYEETFISFDENAEEVTVSTERTEIANSDEHRDLIVQNLEEQGITDITITPVDQTGSEWIDGRTFTNIELVPIALELGEYRFARYMAINHPDMRSGFDNAALTLVVLAESKMIDDVTIAEHADLFIRWDENWTGRVGAIVRDPDSGYLYRKIGIDYENPNPSSQPSIDKNQWEVVGNPDEKWPDWSQPLGIHDAYPIDAQVTHVGRHWMSSEDNNIWEPGVHGWNHKV